MIKYKVSFSISNKQDNRVIENIIICKDKEEFDKVSIVLKEHLIENEIEFISKTTEKESEEVEFERLFEDE